MVIEIVTNTWCSLCYQADERVEGRTITPLLLPGMRHAKSLDLCESHEKELVAALVQALAEHGVAVQEKGAGAALAKARPMKPSEDPSEGPFFCKVVPCTGYNKQGYSSRARLGSHLRHNHDMTLTGYIEQYGLEGPAPEGDPSLLDDVPEESASCEICGKTYSTSRGNKRPKQAVGVHKATEHGIRGAKQRKAS